MLPCTEQVGEGADGTESPGVGAIGRCTCLSVACRALHTSARHHYIGNKKAGLQQLSKSTWGGSAGRSVPIESSGTVIGGVTVDKARASQDKPLPNAVGDPVVFPNPETVEKRAPTAVSASLTDASTSAQCRRTLNLRREQRICRQRRISAPLAPRHHGGDRRVAHGILPMGITVSASRGAGVSLTSSLRSRKIHPPDEVISAHPIRREVPLLHLACRQQHPQEREEMPLYVAVSPPPFRRHCLPQRVCCFDRRPLARLGRSRNDPHPFSKVCCLGQMRWSPNLGLAHAEGGRGRAMSKGKISRRRERGKEGAPSGQRSCV